MPDRIVIVGAGAAGATAALALRRHGHTGSVVVVGTEPEVPYRRPPLSKDLLAGRTQADRIRLRPAAAWAAEGIDLRTGVTATGLDRNRHVVVLSDGGEVGYDRLLLATGSRPRQIPGASVLRTLADARQLGDRTGPGRRLLVIGAGLIGLEVAATALALGTDVTVLERADGVLERVLPPWLAEPIADLHRVKGVDLHLGTAVDAVTPLDGGGVLVEAADRSWQADHVLAAIGTEPETALAAGASLAVDDGIVVDEYLATSDPDVFAAGDAARPPRGRGEHWPGAQEQGRTAAANLLGAGVRYTEVPWCWTDQYDVTLQLCGVPHGDATVDGDPAAHDATVSFTCDGQLVGVVCCNRPRAFQALRTQVADEAGRRPVQASTGGPLP